MRATWYPYRRNILQGGLFIAALLFVATLIVLRPGTAADATILVAERELSPGSMAQAPALAPTPTLVAADVIVQANAMEQVMINLYQRVDPSVVNIEVNIDSSDDIDATGSGFVYDTDGHIITNGHVIEGARDISVTFYDGYNVPAKLIGKDEFGDLAVIQVNVPKERLLPVTFADSSKLQVGQRVIAIGNPFGLLSSMTTGIVSATGRTLNSRSAQYRNPSIIQTDAQINPGNSGGPLLDLNGHVIGINTAISSDTGTFQGVGFAVPSNTVKRIVPQLIKSGKAQYPWLGITSSGSQQGLTVASLAARLNLPVQSGVLISEVVENSPAAEAGLHGGTKSQTIRGVPVQVGGDIITAINGTLVRDMDALLGYLVANSAPGDKVTLTVVRGNDTIQVEVTLKARPPDVNQ